MSNTQFTPGPWIYNGITKITADNGKTIIEEGIKPFSERGQNNAYLKAAAPDMYEALEYTESILSTLIESFGWDEKNLVNVSRAKLRAALNKANPNK